MMKKILAMVMTFTLLLSLCACGASGGTEEESAGEQVSASAGGSEEASSEASGEGSIVLHIASQKVEWGDAWDQLKEAYMASHPEIADIEYTLVSGNDLYTQLQAMLQTGSFPDVTQIQDGYRLLSWKEHLLPLNDYTELFSTMPSDTVMAGFTDPADGTIYGVPTHTEAWGVLYNMQILEQAGVTEVPQTKSEFIDMCEKLQAADLPMGVNYYKESYVWTVHAPSMMGAGQTGAGYTDYFYNLIQNTDLDLANDEGVNNYIDFLDLSLKYGNADSLTMDRSTAQGSFYNGDYAFITIGGTWNNSQILEANPDILEHIQLGPNPLTEDAAANDIVGITQGMCVYKDSPNRDAAIEWLTWLVTSEEAAEILVNTSSVSVCRNDIELTAEKVGVLPAQADTYVKEGRMNTLFTFFDDDCANDVLIASQKYIGGASDRATFIADLETAYENMASR